jgi:tetratricopeptide (TPR) repeat protein
MKKYYLYAGVAATILAAIFFLLNRPRPEAAPIPPLLQRQGPISSTSEWLNTKAAIEGLQTKIRRKPEDLQSKLLLAFAYMQEARITGQHPYYFPAALNLVNDILDRQPDKPVLRFEATVAKASIQLSLHQFSQALATARKALQINSRAASVYGVLCDAHVELGNYPEAIQMADQMVALRPDLRSYSRVSYLREIHGDLPGAIEAMELAASAGYPGLEQTAWTRVTLGQLHEKIGELEKAEKHYRRALGEYPNYAFALAGLGRLATKKQQPAAALRFFSQAAGILPEFSFQEELIRLYRQQGQEKKAARTMKEMLEGLEEDQQAGHVIDLELARIYLELARDPDRALTYARKEYTRRPSNIDVCRTLAHIYYARQEYEKAAAYMQQATRTNSQDPGLLCLHGLIAYKRGHQALGENLIRKSLAMNPYQDDPLSQEGKSLLSKSLSKLKTQDARHQTPVAGQN